MSSDCTAAIDERGRVYIWGKWLGQTGNTWLPHRIVLELAEASAAEAHTPESSPECRIFF